LTVSKEEMQRREAEWQKANGKKTPAKSRDLWLLRKFRCLSLILIVLSLISACCAGFLKNRIALTCDEALKKPSLDRIDLR